MRDQHGLPEFRGTQGHHVVQEWWQKQTISNKGFELGNHGESLGGAR